MCIIASQGGRHVKKSMNIFCVIVNQTIIHQRPIDENTLVLTKYESEEKVPVDINERLNKMTDFTLKKILI